MNPQLKWLIQVAGAIAGLVTVIEAGRRQGWI